jgi:hypothetical protein
MTGVWPRPRFGLAERVTLIAVGAVLVLLFVLSWVDATRDGSWDALAAGAGVLMGGAALIGLGVAAILARLAMSGAVARVVTLLLGPAGGVVALVVVARTLT